MPAYILKTFRGGISDENDKGVAGSFKHGYNLDIHSQDDVLKCGSTAAVVTPSGMVDMIKYMVPFSDGTTYCFGSSGSMWARNGTTGEYNFAYNDENGEIKGAAEWKESGGTTYLYWATNTSVARAAINGSLAVPWAAGVATQDYKTTLDSAEHHTMDIASGVLAIANANALATIDYNGNFNPLALNIRPGNLIKALEERDDYVILASYRADNAEEGHLWSWITTAQNWIQKKKIPVKGVNALMSAELMLLQGGSDGELFYSDFNSAIPLHGIPGGGQVTPSGVTIDNKIVALGMFGGSYPGIWTYGRTRKNRPYALNYQYRLTPTIGGSSISTIGAIANINGTLLASWGTTETDSGNFYSVYGVDQISSTTKATALYEGLEFDNGDPALRKIFNTVKVAMVELPSGCSISVKYRMNKQTSWDYAVLGDKSTTFSVAGANEAIFSIGLPATTFEIGIELNPSGSSTPEILGLSTYLAKETYDYA